MQVFIKENEDSISCCCHFHSWKHSISEGELNFFVNKNNFIITLFEKKLNNAFHFKQGRHLLNLSDEKTVNNYNTQNRDSYEEKYSANQQITRIQNVLGFGQTETYNISNSGSKVTIEKNGQKFKVLEGPYEYDLTEFTKWNCSYTILLRELY